MASDKINLIVKVPWWANFYVWCCIVLADVLGRDLDVEKMAEFLVRHSRLT